MRKRITSLLLTLVMLLSLVPAMGVTASAADDTYGYGNIKNWDWFKSYLESPTSRDLTLENDIDYTTGYDDGAILIKKSQKLDLNGHKIRIDASKRAEFYNLITIRSGEFTLYDSKGGGAIEVEFARDSKGHCIIMISPDSAGAPAKFTMNGGTLTRLNPIDSNVYGNNGCISDNYFVPFEGGERPQITINGGTINCPYSWDRSNASMRQVEYMPTALLLRYSNLTVKGGTFNGIVWTDKLSWKEGDAEPRVLLNGGEFNFPFAVTSLLENKTQMVIDGARFNDGLYVTESIKESNYKGNEPAMLIKSGVFDASGQYLKLDIYGVTRERGYDLRVKQQVIERVMKFFPNSAIKVNGKIYTSENIGSRVIFDDSPYGGSFYLNLNLKGPIEVIPNAWGMKSVTLDGDPIDYFKDWKGTVERMDNSTAHTLKFEWYPLASELVNAGYTYRTTCEHYISGSTAVQQTDTIAADKTSHTITIPAGADPKVYSYDLQLNLDKNGSSVGIIGNQHIVKLVVSEAADTFISTVSFNVDKADVGEPGELSFEAKDKNGNTVAIHPNVTWEHDNIQEGINHVSFTIPAPDGYTFSGENGKVTTLKFGGVDVIGYVDGDGALNYSFPLDVVHRHKADHVSYNAKYHWEACSCGQKIMNTSEQHTMSDWVAGDTLPSGGVVYNRSCISGCGYTETTIDYKNVKHVTSLVLNMENYPMDGMRPHNFVHQEGDETVADTEIPGQSFYKLTHRDSTIKYPSFSIATGNEKVKLSATNPEAYDDPAENPDFAKWTTKDGTLWLRPDTEYSDYEKEFKTGAKYKAHLTLDAKNGYAFYEDFKTNQDNFKLYTDMEGITIEQYGVRRWYYFSNKPSYDDANVPEGWGWYTQAPADNSAGASRVQIVFMITARNEGDLNITLPELKAGDDLKEKWAVFEGTPNFDFVKDCYRSETMAWRSGPSCVIHNNTVTGESVTAQAGQTYRLEIPAVNENVLAHITIKNPTAATKIVEMPSGAITVTYTLPAAADDKIVNGAAVSITPPASGATPNTTAAVTGTAHCTASTVTWTPDEAAFGEKAYTATVTLTAETDYTFANDAVFTINGHKVTPEAGSTTTSVTLSYAFPALAGPHTHTYGSWIFATPDTHIRYCTTNDGSYEEAPHSITSWTDKGDGKTHTGTCTDCGYEKTENHSWEVDHEVPPTVTAEGTRYYKCSACAADKTESIPKLIEYSVTVKDDGNGTASASPAKAVAGTEITLSAKAKSGYHFKEWKVVTGSVIITDNKFTMPDEAVEIKAIFEKNTSTGGSTGGGGGGVTTYAITVKDSKNGDVIASHKSAAKGTTVILTVDPDKGYVLDTLTVLDGNNKDLKLTEKNGKYTFTMPASKVTVAATFKASAPTGKNPFIDVPAGSYYEDAVVWAVEKGITSGTSAVTFDPNGICTRAQAVTFLWRAAGSPAPKSMNSFADVPADAYYAKAVAWAVENGITSGTGGGKFSPDATCTRAQIVTFLYRAAGSPAVSGGSVFSDVKAGAYYADAVTWAANKGITGGIGNGLFGSDNNCTRAQVVTFLYRYVE
ncbi:S-layer homology domain-containing protein [Lawsonibacter hominis]|uniref:S-layer homology domain-containing protein n=1 Tax=Lawsonibacter hominis TaxID=2763053 RepID=A0A8J6MAG7_9FIRM|nr:S-layer homology domain-containing protein [Lawsonibacter hominis]MBC5734465.1 S-layer homology domain-containing protein [Lawsonibacter hominis]